MCRFKLYLYIWVNTDDFLQEINKYTMRDLQIFFYEPTV